MAHAGAAMLPSKENQDGEGSPVLGEHYALRELLLDGLEMVLIQQ